MSSSLEPIPICLAFFLLGIPLALYVQNRMNSQYSKWSAVRNAANLTGEQVAKGMLEAMDLSEILVGSLPRGMVSGTSGQLTDHYDPRDRTIYLSASVAHTPSIASLAVAAHTVTFFEMDYRGRFWFLIRKWLVPLGTVGLWLGILLLVVGFFANVATMVWFGFFSYLVSSLFALSELPAQLEANRRGVFHLQALGYLRSSQEVEVVKSILSTAALTYVVSIWSPFTTLLYYVFIALNLDGRRRG